MSGSGRLIVTVVTAVVLTVLATLGITGQLGRNTVATVNGERIREKEFVGELKDRAGKAILDQLINQELIRQAAAKENIVIKPEEIDTELSQIRSSYPSDSFFKTALKQNNMTEEGLRDRLRLNLVLERLASRDVKVTEDEIKEYFNRNKDQFATPEQIKAYHILVKTRDEAEEVLKELRDGADFGELAGQKSIDPGSKDKGGDLGYVQRGDTVAAFEEAVFSLDEGQLSQPVETEYGFHVIKVEDHKEAAEATLESARAEVEKVLIAQKSTPLETVLEELRRDAKIDVSWSGYAEPVTAAADSDQEQKDQ